MRLSLALAAALCMTTSAATAQSSARDRATVLMSESEDMRAIQQQIGFNDAIVTDDGHVYLSGIVVSLAPGDSDIESAFAETYTEIGTILERAGADWGDIVDILSFHTDLASQMEPMIAVQQRYIAEPFPAWTAIQVERLIPDQGITEIKIVARIAARD
ncbi:MAG: Rid family hydrolase [Parasphingopyxis sp.]